MNRVSSFSRYHNGTFSWMNCSPSILTQMKRVTNTNLLIWLVFECCVLIFYLRTIKAKRKIQNCLSWCLLYTLLHILWRNSLPSQKCWPFNPPEIWNKYYPSFIILVTWETMGVFIWKSKQTTWFTIMTYLNLL